MELIDQIKEHFKRTPSDLEGIKKLLSSQQLTEDELAELAISFADECFYEYNDAIHSENKSVRISNMHSNYIIEAIDLLLQFGLDPNTIVKGDNVMWSAMWIDAPNVAASLLRLLLEHGGDPNHYLPREGDSIFGYIDVKVSIDEYTHDFFHTVQCWLLLMGYGARWRNGELSLTMLGENSVKIFKNFERYDYEIELLPQKPRKHSCWFMHILDIVRPYKHKKDDFCDLDFWIMHIFDVETKEEVAVYKSWS